MTMLRFIRSRAAPALALFVSACVVPASPPAGAAGPVEAAQAFAKALSDGNPVAAWGLLSQRTQQQADRLAQTVADAGPGAPASGRQMLFNSALAGGPVEVRELSRIGDTAELEVSTQKEKRAYRAVREGSVWKIELPLEPAAAPPAPAPDAGR